MKKLLSDVAHYVAVLVLVLAGIRAGISLASVSLSYTQRLDGLESRLKVIEQSRNSVAMSTAGAASKVLASHKTQKRSPCPEAGNRAIEVIHGTTISRIQVAKR